MGGVVRWGVLAAVLAFSVGVCAAGDDKDTREAKARFVEGVSRARKGDWEGARRSFQQSLAVRPSQAAVFNLALAEEKCDRPLEALATFKDYAHRYSLSEEEGAQAHRHIADLMEKTAHVDVQAPTGTVLLLDGSQPAGTAPLAEPLDVAPGHHVLEAKGPQGAKSLPVDARAGQLVHVTFGIDSEEKAPAPAAATPKEPPTSGPAAPAAPPETPETPPSGGGSGVSAGRVVTVVALASGAVAAGVLGLYFGQQSNNDANKATSLNNANPRCQGATSDGCQQLKDAVSSAHSEHVTADGLFIGGAALAVAAVATWVLWPTAPAAISATEIRLLPVAGATSVGAMAVGRF